MEQGRINQCALCEYSTQSLYNYRRHLKIHEKETANPSNNPLVCAWCSQVFTTKGNCDRHVKTRCLFSPVTTHAAQNVNTSAQNVDMAAQNVYMPAQNVYTPAQNVYTANPGRPNSCPKCKKTFNRNFNLERHTLACKGELHPFECHKCHMILSSRTSKSRHMKQCTVGTSSTTIINNNNNTTNNTNSHNTITNNNVTNNYNILNFGQEDKSHMTDEFVMSIASMKHGHGIMKCIEALHFNPDVPQNQNLRLIEGGKQTDIAVRSNDQWYATDHMRVLPRLLGSTKCYLLGFIHSIKDKLDPIDYLMITQSLQEGVDWIKNSQQFHYIKRQLFIAMEKLSKIVEEDVIDRNLF